MSTPTWNNIETELQDGVLRAWLNRPEKVNALNHELWTPLDCALHGEAFGPGRGHAAIADLLKRYGARRAEDLRKGRVGGPE